MQLATCAYIADRRNVIILGATGSGKTYISSALGMAACRRFFSVKYIRLPDLLNEFSFARRVGS
jgi:DNA replication protein DnaC